MAPPAPRLIPGRLSVHRDGYGFLIPDSPVEGIEGDIYLPPSAAAKAMHGDRVAVRLTRFSRDGRAEGDIARVLERAHQTVVGRFHVRGREMWLEPQDRRLSGWISIPPELALPPPDAPADRIAAPVIRPTRPTDLDGLIVNADIIRFPTAHEPAVGRVTEVLGAPGDFGVDVEIIIRKHHLPHRFPPDVLEEARRVPSAVTPSDLAAREDFRHLPVVTIDGETARDFDDAVYLTRRDHSRFELHVHIADVSRYVLPGTAIDREAALRTTSVYFPDRAVPMLPLELSTNICSLLPHTDRLVLSVLLEIDHQGDIVAQRFTRGVIRSAERMTYTDVHALLEGDPARRERYAPLVASFEDMRELALKLQHKRMRRGSIDFDLPEPLLEFDEFGQMTAITRGPRNIAHRIIEEFMLAANEAVASHLAQTGAPMLYRIHESPDPRKVLEFDELARQFGHSLTSRPIPARRFPQVTRHADGRKTRRDIYVTDSTSPVTSRHYQRLVARLEGRPEERILNYLMLRSLKQARYSADPHPHFALASPCYTHFTSPIRRYPDLLVHRILTAALAAAAPPYPHEGLARSADACSAGERTAAEAERELVEWKKIEFMTAHIGDEFDALIISLGRSGLFVELDEIFVEGFVPLDTLPGDHYGYHESSRRIIGERSRREFRLGGRLRVRLDRIDGVEKKLLFSVLTPPPLRSRPQ